MSTPTINGEKQADTAPQAPLGARSSEWPGSEARGARAMLERVSVNLSFRSVAALDSLGELTRETKTDSINKALQFYAYIQQLFHSGGALYIREPVNYQLERLHVL